MRTRNIEIKISVRLTVGFVTPKDFFIETTIYDDWIDTPKSKLELILEQSPYNESPPKPNTEDLPQYKYLASLNIEDAANETLGLVIKRYMLFRRTLSDENKSKLDEIFTDHQNQLSSGKVELNKKLKSFLSKEKIAAFHHINDAYSSIFLAFTSGIGVKVLLAGLYVLYSGDQRFFKEQIKARSEIASEGGIARKALYLAVKQKSCELLNELTPQEGWPHELNAFKAILPKTKDYLKDNDIKRPASSSIERTLRRWIKEDPLVSAAVRIRNQPSTDKGIK